MRQEYTDFILGFEKISPYELDHFCKVFFTEYKKLLSEIDATPLLGVKELRDVFIRTVQLAQVEIAQKKVEEANLNYELVRSRLLLE
jgi:hypothetical protein